MSLDSILRSIGKNLFDINTTPTFTRTGATYAVSGTTITFKSNNTTNNSFLYSIPVEIGKTYTVSVSSIDWDSTSLGIFLSSTNALDHKDYGIINKTTLSKTFTAIANTLWIHGYLSYAAGDFTFSFDKLQVEQGSTATSYEPYQQGPKSIKIGDKEVLKVSYGSKNLIPYPFTFESITSYGITFTDNKNGTITLNGQLSDNTTPATYVLFNNTNINKLGLKPNINYYLSCSDSSLTVSLRTVKTDGTNKFYSYGNIKFSSEETPDRLFLQVKKDDTRTFENTVISIQLELGDKVTEYVPYSREVVWTKT